MKFVLRGFAAVVLASTTLACTAPTEEPTQGVDQEDQVRLDSGKEEGGPSFQPQYLAPPTTCNDAQLEFARDDNWAKRGITTYVTGCTYNASTGYVTYTYQWFLVGT